MFKNWFCLITFYPQDQIQILRFRWIGLIKTWNFVSWSSPLVMMSITIFKMLDKFIDFVRCRWIEPIKAYIFVPGVAPKILSFGVAPKCDLFSHIQFFIVSDKSHDF